MDTKTKNLLTFFEKKKKNFMNEKFGFCMFKTWKKSYFCRLNPKTGFNLVLLIPVFGMNQNLGLGWSRKFRQNPKPKFSDH